ncbi:MAG: NAD-dependent epimerase/dehydratase family protein [Anaerolineae bacterium]
MKKIIVTGGSGKAGRAVIGDLQTHGYVVRNVDRAGHSQPGDPSFLYADLSDYGQTVDAFAGYDAVVHLAAIPAPDMYTDEVTFRNNITSTYNVFQAAVTLGMERVVWASSETILGLPFDDEQPDYAPIDENQTPYPESSYALSKLLSEEMARQFNRRYSMPFVGLRISNIMEAHDYERFPAFWGDPMLRKWNLWGYVDARDVAQACRLGLEANTDNADVFIIAAADTCMTTNNQALMQQVYPDVELRDSGDFETLLSIDKAREVLGYHPQHSWRNYHTI